MGSCAPEVVFSSWRKGKYIVFLDLFVFTIQIITVEEAKRRKSTCSYYEEDEDTALPILQPHSALLENMHIEQVVLPGDLGWGLPGSKRHFPTLTAFTPLILHEG